MLPLIKFFKAKRNRVVLVATSSLLLVLLVVSLSRYHSSNKNHNLKVAPVVLVTNENLADNIVLTAELYPFQEVDIYSKVAGYLKSITVDEGSAVKKDQPIATIDVDELRSDLNRNKASYNQAKLDYNRIKQVIEKHPGLLAEEEVDKSYEAYQMAKANYEKSQTLFEYANIKAPFDGVVTKRYVDPGALVQSAINSNTQATPIVHIADNTKLRIIFPVPESAVPKIKIGTKVKILVQSTNQEISSEITTISGKINPSTRTMDTEIYIDNKEYKITPGMYASVRLDLQEKNAVLALPIQAVSLGDNPNVWLINNDNQIEERKVVIGIQTADKIEITSGLNQGDKVLFGNRSLFSIGMKVDPKLISTK